MSGKLDMLIFGAHPDDAEIGMGAAIYKHVQAGMRVGICDLTYAELSSNGTVELRQREAEEASRLLGLAARSNLGLPDRGLEVKDEQIRKITREIRKYRPRLVFAPYWIDRHPDHVLCSQLVQEAVFNAKLRNYEPEMEAVQVEQLYFYFINDTDKADIMIDVSAEHAVKMEVLSAYRSQFEAADPAKNIVATPLNQAYLERVEARDRLLGQKRSVAYAEGFVSRLPLMVGLF